MNRLLALTKRKESDLKNLGFKYITKWDHCFRKEIENNSQLVTLFDINMINHDFFFGGRVNATCLSL